MKPSVGRIVHYHTRASDQPVAAIVTYVHDAEAGLVDLALFGVSKEDALSVPLTTTREYGCWSWPPRAE